MIHRGDTELVRFASSHQKLFSFISDLRVNRFARGWGVLVLPESSFLPTKTFKESLGISPIEATYVYHEGYGYYIDINEGIHHVKNNSPVHWLWRENKAPFLNAAPIAHNFDTRCAWYNPGFDFDKDWDCTQDMAADHPSSTPPPVLPKDKGPNNYAKLLAHGSSGEYFQVPVSPYPS